MTSFATADQLRHIVQAATLAPSVHNTQPWRFVEREDGVELHLDPDRQLHVLDPDARQLHLSCGAALFHARVAAQALGLDLVVQLMTAPGRQEHLADLLVRQGAPASSAQIRLAAAMLHRRTSRDSFDDRVVPAALLERLRRHAEAEGALLQQVSKADDLLELEVLLSRADAAEERDGAYRDELERWVHVDAAASDGLSGPAAQATAAGSSFRQRDFTLSRPAVMDGRTPAAEHPAVVVLATREDDRAAWLRAGQALASVLLHAADEDVQAQPLGQVTDQLADRLRLRTVLGLVATPQLVLRMGYRTEGTDTAASPRRELDEVLTSVRG